MPRTLQPCEEEGVAEELVLHALDARELQTHLRPVQSQVTGVDEQRLPGLQLILGDLPGQLHPCCAVARKLLEDHPRTAEDPSTELGLQADRDFDIRRQDVPLHERRIRHRRHLSDIGRRPIIIAGQAGLTTALALLGVFFLLPESTLRSYLVLGGILMFLFFMQSCIGPIFWLLLAEIFPLRMRGFATGLEISFVWIANTVVSLLFPILIEAIAGYTFFLFALINVGTLVFYVTSVPETKGRSLERVEAEMEELFTGSMKTLA